MWGHQLLKYTRRGQFLLSLKMLNIAKGRKASIYRTIKRCNETGETNDKPRSVRPCSVGTAALNKRVRERIPMRKWPRS